LALVLAIGAQVVLGEMVARSVGAQRPVGTLRAVGVPARLVTRALSPFALVGDALARRVVAAFGADRSEVLSRMRSRKELIRLVQLSERSGAIRSTDAELLQRTLRFGEKRAADAITPRVEIESLPVDATVGDLIDRSGSTGLSRFPVHGEDLDDIVGVVHVKDVLGVAADGRREQPLAALLRPVHAVPESKDLESLIVELSDAAGQFAVVVDEYGGTAGIITLEDVIEEIVGDIADEHDPAMSSPPVRRWAGAHLVSGSLHPDQVFEACEFSVPEGDYETIAGFVMSELGRVPDVGDHLEHDGWDLEVIEVEGHRIRTVKLVAPSPGSLGAIPSAAEGKGGT
jgi:CBS domain containing-hemolysin-like protein